MGRISTHILDISRGRPAAEVPVALERVNEDGNWQELGRAFTDADGRVEGFADAGPLQAAVHRLRFDVAEYFRAQGATSFYPFVEIVFEIARAEEHYHVPLLLSPFGYSTYRGS